MIFESGALSSVSVFDRDASCQYIIVTSADSVIFGIEISHGSLRDHIVLFIPHNESD